MFAIAVSAALFSGATATKTLAVASQKYMWESFKQEYGKTYRNVDEEGTRFGNFLKNLDEVAVRNELEQKAGGSALHGITKFSDLSQVKYTYLTVCTSIFSTKCIIIANIYHVEFIGTCNHIGGI